jgi:predicted ferric reductase
MTFGQAFWLVVEIFFFVAYLVILFHIFGDLFRDKSIGGFAKAMWVLFLIILPWLGALIYLIARGNGMAERAQAAYAQQRAATDQYIRDTVSSSSPADEISKAQQLLSTGAITPEEFANIKAKALASA